MHVYDISLYINCVCVGGVVWIRTLATIAINIFHRLVMKKWKSTLYFFLSHFGHLELFVAEKCIE